MTRIADERSIHTPAERRERPAVPLRTIEEPQYVVRMIESFRPYLLSCAVRYWKRDVRRKIDESDLVQLAVIRGIERHQEFRGKTSGELASWLHQILRRLMITYRRKLKSQKADIGREQSIGELQLIDSAPSALQNVMTDELKQRVREAIAALPDHYREIVELHQFAKMPFSEIGYRLDKSPDAVRKLWGRAVCRLQTTLKSQVDSGIFPPASGKRLPR